MSPRERCDEVRVKCKVDGKGEVVKCRFENYVASALVPAGGRHVQPQVRKARSIKVQRDVARCILIWFFFLRELLPDWSVL